MAIKTTDLHGMGWKSKHAIERALKAANAGLAASMSREEVIHRLSEIRRRPHDFLDDLIFSETANAIIDGNQ